MDYVQYQRLVKERAGFENDDQVTAAIRAVLEVLSGRLTFGEAADLSSLLPKELKPYMLGSDRAEAFGLEEFLDRVGRKEGVEPAIALYHARAVLSVLAAAVPTTELIDALSQLPGDIRSLFEVENWIKRAA